MPFQLGGDASFQLEPYSGPQVLTVADRQVCFLFGCVVATGSLVCRKCWGLSQTREPGQGADKRGGTRAHGGRPAGS